eukprot:2480823-Rhodomonas_salina.2
MHSPHMICEGKIARVSLDDTRDSPTSASSRRWGSLHQGQSTQHTAEQVEELHTSRSGAGIMSSCGAEEASSAGAACWSCKTQYPSAERAHRKDISLVGGGSPATAAAIPRNLA